MNPIVGLFPRRFLGKLNQTESVRARKPAPPGTFTGRPTIYFRMTNIFLIDFKSLHFSHDEGKQASFFYNFFMIIEINICVKLNF